MAGAGIELFQMAAKEIGLQVKPVYVGPWARVQYEAKIGKIDAIAGLYKTREREEYLVFLEPPFIMDPVAVFTTKGKTFPFRRLEDLQDKRGCTVFGNSQGPEFDAFARERLNLKLPRTVKGGFELLLAGHANYMVHGLYPGLAVIETERLKHKIAYLPHFVVSEGLFIGVSKKSPFVPHIPALQAAFKKLKDSGVVEKTMEKHLARWGKRGPKGGVKLEP